MLPSSTHSLQCHTAQQTPNPFKVEIILEEIGVPYEQKTMDITKLKGSSYIDVNPNGLF